MSLSPTFYLNTPDGLSSLLKHLELQAEVYVNGDFCGAWAVDTSGSRRIPFHLVGDGVAWLHLDDRPARSLQPGQLAVFPRDRRHVIAHSEEAPAETAVNAGMEGEGEVTRLICGFFEFKQRSVWPLLETLPEVVVLDLSENESPLGSMVVKLLVSELKGAAPGHYDVVNHLAHLLFVEVLRQQLAEGSIREGLLAALFDTRISRALASMHREPGNRWSLESLAEEAAMSRTTFAEQFRKLVGETPLHYLAGWRMELARKLLQTTPLTLAEIADRCGYESESAFQKAYRRIQGESAGATRRKA